MIVVFRVTWMRIGSHAPAALGGILLFWGATAEVSEEVLQELHLPWTKLAWHAFVLATSGLSLVMGIFGEADRLWMIQALEQQQELLHGYTGKLRDAVCSVPLDGQRIRDEIANSGEESRVDDSVHVLIQATMSTRGLRLAHERGLDIRFAGHYRCSLTFFGWSYWVLLAAQVAHDAGSLCWVAWLPLLLALLWAVAFCCVGRDVRQLAADAAYRGFQVMLIACWCIMFATSFGLSGMSYATLYCAVLLGVVAPLNFLPLMGHQRVLAIPFLGFWLLRRIRLADNAASAESGSPFLACCRCPQSLDPVAV